jgi:hypothetical protein
MFKVLNILYVKVADLKAAVMSCTPILCDDESVTLEKIHNVWSDLHKK